MREVMIIVRRELLERVRTRAFVIGTIAFPLFMAAVLLLPPLMSGGGGEPKLIAVVDEAPGEIGQTFITALELATSDEDDYDYTVEQITRPLEEVRDELNARVQAEELDGYLVLPANVLDTDSVLFRAQNIANTRVLRDLRRGVSVAVQAERLREVGMAGQQLAELIRPVTVAEARITGTDTVGGGAISTFIMAYAVAFLIYFMTAIYGTAIMRSVIEEKTNRISEVLVSTVKSSHLMLGKVIGASSAAVIQVLIWIAMAALLITQSAFVARLFNLEPEQIAAFSVPPMQVVLFTAYFVLGFFLFAAIFAALGAAMTSDQEAQSMQMVAMVPLFLPLLFLVPITNEPLSTMATVLGLFPLTGPIAMPMRIASGPIPPVQVAASLVLVGLAIVFVTWIAGKIFRIGILSTGRRPTLRELGRWLREA